MTLAHVTDRDGRLEMMLDCPACDFYDIVYYTTQPPTYCSNACKQRTYRKRQKRNTPVVTHLVDKAKRNGFQGETLKIIYQILDDYGEIAAQKALDLAILTAKEVRAKTQRHY